VCLQCCQQFSGFAQVDQPPGAQQCGGVGGVCEVAEPCGGGGEQLGVAAGCECVGEVDLSGDGQQLLAVGAAGGAGGEGGRVEVAVVVPAGEAEGGGVGGGHLHCGAFLGGWGWGGVKLS